MGFSCGCDDSDWGIVDEYVRPWAGHKTIKCRECGCELAPGHVVHTVVMAEWWDEPFDEMDDDRLAEVLASDDTDYIHSCERCADLGDAVSDTGMCWSIGELWDAYMEWIADRRVAMKTRPGRWRNDA